MLEQEGESSKSEELVLVPCYKGLSAERKVIRVDVVIAGHN